MAGESVATMLGHDRRSWFHLSISPCQSNDATTRPPCRLAVLKLPPGADSPGDRLNIGFGRRFPNARLRQECRNRRDHRRRREPHLDDKRIAVPHLVVSVELQNRASLDALFSTRDRERRGRAAE